MLSADLPLMLSQHISQAIPDMHASIRKYEETKLTYLVGWNLDGRSKAHTE